MGEARRRRLIEAKRQGAEDGSVGWDGVIPAYLLTEADVNGEATMLLPDGVHVTVTAHGPVSVRQNDDGTITLAQN